MIFKHYNPQLSCTRQYIEEEEKYFAHRWWNWYEQPSKVFSSCPVSVHLHIGIGHQSMARERIEEGYGLFLKGVCHAPFGIIWIASFHAKGTRALTDQPDVLSQPTGLMLFVPSLGTFRKLFLKRYFQEIKQSTENPKSNINLLTV